MKQQVVSGYYPHLLQLLSGHRAGHETPMFLHIVFEMLHNNILLLRVIFTSLSLTHCTYIICNVYNKHGEVFATE